MTETTIYQDANQPVANRVADLLSRMTLDEKIAQLGSLWVFELLDNMQFSSEKATQLCANGLGQVTRIAGASSLDPTASAKLANAIQRHVIENTRLGIPAMMHEECCSGYMARNATCFPQTIGVASSWEPELAEEMANVVRIQMRAAGAHQGLSPVIDVSRDPRWGRVEETFGEDPYLVSQMGVSFVRGLQGDNWHDGIIATAKHFVGYGMPEGGMNWAPPHLAPRELREVFMLPFEAAVKEAKLKSVMNGYHELDGIPCGGSKELLTDILREEWGFDGIVVSDYFAVNQLLEYHQVVSSKTEAASMALHAGIDVELPSTDCYSAALQEAIESNMVAENKLDEVVGRVLKLKFELGLFENPYVDVESVKSVFDSPEQRDLAYRIAQKSIVLLKNEDNLLPLDKNINSIAIIGPNADTVRNIIGDYAYPCHIETLIEMRDADNVFDMPVPDGFELIDDFVPIISILDGLKDKVSDQTTIHYAAGCSVLGDSKEGFAEVVTIAEKSDVAIVVVGGKSGLTNDCTCGESRDRADLNLTGVQQELVETVAATGKPVIVLLVNGRPLSINWIAENIPAIVEAWLPGEEGAAAVADVLFGDVNPGGKLPMTFPRSVGQVPIFYNHKPSGGRSHWNGTYINLSNKPLWPFGHGLSYTQFELSNLQVDKSSAQAGETVTVQCDLTNVGQHAGDEVVQLYTRDAVASVIRPVKELKGFKRIHLTPQETKTITFELSVNQFGFYDRNMKYIVEPGVILLMIGTSSEAIQLEGEFTIVGDVTEIDQDKVFF
ncbi:glycoside hydrolase family 3 N-terminal domain-containing protein, partial [Anaerolineales bacterium HSG24]|nr:glycoside hydrolase family 3 N-terminal domain-containing protein [Anaerolineales bacterium HSG24]